jgi:hypothetical protein
MNRINHRQIKEFLQSQPLQIKVITKNLLMRILMKIHI